VINEGRAEWKHALAAAKEKLDDLQKVAAWVRNNEGRYIRPILLVRVERTGRDQRDKQEIHAEDVREYLIDKMGADKDQIKVKSAEMDELAEVDKRPEYEGKGLLSEFCPVRYIITKDALREGWDCPFAYVLAVLSRTTAAVALTQMVGRVLRQPDAKWTGEPELNECYVFTHDQDVHAAVDNVRRGLQEEGLGDLAASVTAAGKGAAAGSRTETLRRRRAFRGVNVFMPRVLSKHYATGEWREFDYERDMLPRLDWNAYRYTDRDVFTPDEMEGLDRTRVRVDVGDLSKQDADLLAGATVTTEESDPAIDVPAMVRLLLDVVPNPWQGARIVGEALTALRARGLSENRIFTNRLFLVKAIKENVRTQINDASEAAFRRMLADGDLSFQLVSSGDPALNWELAQTLELEITDEDRVLLRKNGASLEKSFLEPIYQKQVNELEREVAWYLDGDKAVKWWHRIAVKQDWHLQGWQRGRIYPDFLACLHDNGDGTMQFRVLETKGLHLKGNEDTAYKERLFELLTQYSQSAVPVGELLIGGAKQRIRFDLMLENNWRERLPASLAY
jgi:type III restriction enzyme